MNLNNNAQEAISFSRRRRGVNTAAPAGCLEKAHILRSWKLFAVLILVYGALSARTAIAAGYQWDVNGASAGLGGTGTWNTSNLFWDELGTGSDDGTDATVAYTFTSGDTAAFGGTAGTVTVGVSPAAAIKVDTVDYIFQVAANKKITLSGLVTIAGSGVTTFQSTGNSGTFVFSGGIDLNGGDLICTKRNDGPNGPYLFSGAIQGSGSIELKQAAATAKYTFEAANSYSGTTTVSGGYLNIDNATALGVSTLVLNGGGIDCTKAGGITLTPPTPNPQQWNTDFTFLGSRDLNLGTGAVTLGGARVVTVSGSTLTVGGGIGDGGNGYGLTKAGAGTLTLDGISAYGGTTTINEGTLALGASGSITNTPLITLAEGALLDISAGGMMLAAGQTLIGGRTSGFTTDILGDLTLAGSIKPAGDGTVGTITIAGDLDLAGGTVSIDVAPGSVSDSIDLGGTGSFSVSALTVISVSAEEAGIYTIISGSTTTTIPTENLAVSGNGSLSASFDNTTAGTLKLILASAGSTELTWNGTPAPGNIWNAESGNQNWLDSAAPAAFSDGDIAVFDGSAAENSVNISATVAPLAVVVKGAEEIVFSGNASITGICALEKSDAGNLVISNANTYSGGTTINGGTVTLGHATDSLADAGPVVINGGTLYIGDNSDTVGSLTLISGSITGTVGTLNAASYSTEGGSIAATLEGAGSLTKTSAGTLLLGGPGCTYSGGTFIDEGILALAADNVLADTGAIAVGGGTLDIGVWSDSVGELSMTGGSILGDTGTLSAVSYAFESGTVSARLSGAGPMSKTTTGTLSLSGDNSAFSGTATLSAGIIQIGHDNALGTGLTVIQGGTILPDGGARTLPGDFRIDAGTTLSSGTLNFEGDVTLNASINMSDNGVNNIFSGNISGTGGLTRNAGSGSLTLSGTNDFSGGITWSSGIAVLTLANDQALGTGTYRHNSTGPIRTGSQAVANPNDNAIELNSSLNFQGPQDLDFGAGAVTLSASRIISVTAGTLTFGGPVGESAAESGITKQGAGILVLGGTNTYTGATLVSGGSLLINGKHENPSAENYAVTNGASLGGSGIIGLPVTIHAASRLAPGGENSTGILTVDSDVTLSQSATLQVRLGGNTAGTDYDRLVVAGDFTCGDALLTALVANGKEISENAVYEIVRCEGQIIGTFADLPDGTKITLPGTETQMRIRYRTDSSPSRITLSARSGGTILLLQ